MRNIAEFGSAAQSSLSRWSHGGDEANNVLTGRIVDGYAFHTGREEKPWLMIDLKDIYPLCEIGIEAGRDFQYPAGDFEIFLSEDGLNYASFGSPEPVSEGACSLALKHDHARFVYIRLNRKDCLCLSRVKILVDDHIIRFRDLNLYVDLAVSDHMRRVLRSEIYEAEEINLALENAGPIDRILELGSSVGVMSAMLKKKYPELFYIAVEANKDIFNIMQTNHKLNNINNVRYINRIASFSDHETYNFFISKDFWGSSLIEFPDYKRIEKIKSFDINKIIRANKINFIICDIEGGEYAIFNEKVNLENVDKILLELHNKDDESKIKLAEFLASRNFRPDSPLDLRKGQQILFFRKA